MLVVILSGLTYYAIGQGFIEGKNSARIVMILLCAFVVFVDVLVPVFEPMVRIFFVLINLIYILVLIANKEIKAFFKTSGSAKTHRSIDHMAIKRT